MEGINYDSDYEESLLLSAPYLEKQNEDGVDAGTYIRFLLSHNDFISHIIFQYRNEIVHSH